jgi:peptide/nickel transport system permease protein
MREVLGLGVRLIVLLFGVYTLVFVGFAVLPLDPARLAVGPNADEAALVRARRAMGVDRPIPVRYGRSVAALASGDLGESFYYQRPVSAVLLEQMPRTLWRAVGGLLAGTLLGFAVANGTMRQGTGIAVWVLTVLQSIPSFCLMVLFLWVGARGFGVTPMGSPHLYEAFTIAGVACFPMGAVGLFLLDGLSLRAGRPPYVEFLSMLHAPPDAVQGYVRRGLLPGATLIAINAIVPVITGVSFAELVFGLPGFGLVFFRSCERGDVSVVAGGALVLAAIVAVLYQLGEFLVRRWDARLGEG